MAIALLKMILTLVVAVFLITIYAANDFATTDGEPSQKHDGKESVRPIEFWGSELYFTHGVTAALFALAAAAILFVSLVPAAVGTTNIVVESLHRFVGALAAAGAGGYWLRSEAGETAWLHLAMVLFLGGVLIVAGAVPIAIVVPLKSLTARIRRRQG